MIARAEGDFVIWREAEVYESQPRVRSAYHTKRLPGGLRGTGPELRAAIEAELDKAFEGRATSAELSERINGPWTARSIIAAASDLFHAGILERDAALHDRNNPPRYWRATEPKGQTQ